MADITVECRIVVDKDGFKDSIETGVVEIDQSNVGGGNPGTVEIGTSEEEVDFSEMTQAGVVWIKNLDDTNFVNWGFSTGVLSGRIEAGEFAGPFRLESGASIFFQSDTAACLLQIKAYEA